MEQDNQLGFEFPALGRRKIEANFAGGQVSSDGGLMLLRQVDRWLGFTKQLDGILPQQTGTRFSFNIPKRVFYACSGRQPQIGARS